MLETYNFKLENYNYEKVPGHEGQHKDLRNGIICIAPTFDLECYLNYIQLLNFHRDKWKSFGYLDLGMMPLAMAPSFMQTSIKPILVKAMKQMEIDCISLPPVSVMYETSRMPEEDIWVFKSDVAEKFGIDKDKVTLERLLRRLMNDPNRNQ